MRTATEKDMNIPTDIYKLACAGQTLTTNAITTNSRRYVYLRRAARYVTFMIPIRKWRRYLRDRLFMSLLKI
jgi:hypothetical protein